MRAELHYIHDPHCGWCYAAEPLVTALAERAGASLPIVLHGGGLFHRMQLPAETRAYIRGADGHIAALSGQTFGDAYLNGLLNDENTVFDSLPLIAAVLAAQMVRHDAGLHMLRAIQHAHYVDGRRVVEPEVLADLAQSIGITPAVFTEALDPNAARMHIEDTRRFMARTGAQGFPAFILQRDGQLRRLAHERFYGKPEAFVEMILSACSE